MAEQTQKQKRRKLDTNMQVGRPRRSYTRKENRGVGHYESLGSEIAAAKEAEAGSTKLLAAICRAAIKHDVQLRITPAEMLKAARADGWWGRVVGEERVKRLARTARS